jgi:hypothetical protein
MSIPQHYLKSQFFLQIRKPVGTKLDSGARTNFESSVPNDQAVSEDVLFLCLTYKKLEFPLALMMVDKSQHSDKYLYGIFYTVFF